MIYRQIYNHYSSLCVLNVMLPTQRPNFAGYSDHMKGSAGPIQTKSTAVMTQLTYRSRQATAQSIWPVTECGVDVPKNRANRKGSSSCKSLDPNTGQVSFRSQPNYVYPGWCFSWSFSVPSDKYQGSASRLPQTCPSNLSFSIHPTFNTAWSGVTVCRKMSHKIKSGAAQTTH